MRVNLKDFKFLCDATNLPGRNLATRRNLEQVVYLGHIFTLTILIQQLNLSFILTDDMFVKKLFDACGWMYIIPLTDAGL